LHRLGSRHSWASNQSGCQTAAEPEKEDLGDSHAERWANVSENDSAWLPIGSPSEDEMLTALTHIE